jgi:hypothetical protein
MAETEKDILARLKDASRNDPCPCGSGKKYKKCHLPSDEQAERELRGKANEAAAKKAEAAAKKEAEKGEAKDEAKAPAIKPKEHAKGAAKPTHGTNANHKPVGGPRKMV